MESSKISSPQGTLPAQGTRPRSTAQGPDANNVPAGQGGFLALLAAMGDAPQGDNTVLDLASSMAVPTDDATRDVMDASAMAAWQGLLTPGADAQLDPAAAGDSQAGGILRPGEQDGALGRGVLGESAAANGFPEIGGLPQGMVAETTMLDTSVDRRMGLLPQSGGTAYGRAFSRMQTALAQKADALEMSAVRSPASGVTLQPPGQQGPFLATVQAASERMMMGAPGAGSTSDRNSASLMDPAGSGVAASAVEGLLSSVASAQGGGGADGGGRSGEGRSGASAAWFEGVSGSAPVELGSGEEAAVFTDSAQAGPEEQVAEQVAYWVNQKTQNAELTLSRDGQPVEVSVSLSGNEAHVTFRSDQSQTRELLDRSMAQLSDLLRSEGLVLSGMSVGTSAGQRENSGGSERQSQRDGARQAQVVAAAPAGTASLLRSGSSERSVDIFV